VGKYTVLVNFKVIDGETFSSEIDGDNKDELYKKVLKQVSDLLKGLIYGHKWEYLYILSPKQSSMQNVTPPEATR
jgi:hypothetical protein